MSRSAVDATRFTATSPHAYSKPSSIRSAASNTSPRSSYPRTQTPAHNARFPPNPSPSPGSPKTTTETPAQKVARLRAAHNAQKYAQVSTWDKVVVRGRVIADAAHRFTTLTLIGATVLAGGVAVFSLSDMIVYNRRKRKEFYAEQRMLLESLLAQAQEAAAKGIADEDQMLLINRERAAKEAEEAQKSKKGIWKRVKAVFGTQGLKEEETGIGLGEEGVRKVGEGSQLFEPITGTKTQTVETPSLGILQAVEKKRREGEKELQDRGVEGGPLDNSAEQTSAAFKSKGSWTSWMSSK